MNRQLKSFMFDLLESDSDLIARKALDVMVELYRRQVWTDARSVNVIATACLSKVSYMSSYHPSIVVLVQEGFVSSLVLKLVLRKMRRRKKLWRTRKSITTAIPTKPSHVNEIPRSKFSNVDGSYGRQILPNQILVFPRLLSYTILKVLQRRC